MYPWLCDITCYCDCVEWDITMTVWHDTQLGNDVTVTCDVTVWHFMILWLCEMICCCDGVTWDVTVTPNCDMTSNLNNKPFLSMKLFEDTLTVWHETVTCDIYT